MRTDPLQHGRESYALRAWSEAYDAFCRAQQSAPLSDEDLERLAISAYLVGHDEEFQQVHERLHRSYVEQSQPLRAARSAFWLALTFLFGGEAARANGWIIRGERLIENADCVERGYLQVPVVARLLRGSDLAAARSLAADAAAIGVRFGDADLISIARHLEGHALIVQGHVLTGLGCLDDAMLAVVAKEVSPIVTGLLYCSVLEACRQVYALGRAREWTDAFSRSCAEQPEMVAFTDTCLVHRSEIMQFHGAWPDALAEAGRACARCRERERKPPAAALYQQAEIHRLRGEFAKADEAYRAASEHGCDPQPGLALLRLAQQRIDSAAAALGRLLSTTVDRSRRAGLLPAQIEIMLAAGDLDASRIARDELHELAELFDTDVLRASAQQAQGAIALAGNDAATALDPLRRSFAMWEQLAAPHEAARVRVLIGLACRALGDSETQRLEFAAARLTFERLGARPDLARLDALDPTKARGRSHSLTAREIDVLRLISTGNTNKAIAARLHVSERTVDRHVSNILGKLDVPSRAAATAYAYDNKLL
jgi:DNA-binding CsgD family transcriptional regulator